MVDAKQINFVDELFGNNNNYLIPCYQRNFAWKEEDCEMLWGDIENLILHHNLQEHFMGTIILFDVENSEDNQANMYWIIDGQQRLTVIYILLKALYDLVVQDDNNVILAAKIKTYLYNSNSLKIIPKENDNASLQDIFFHPDQVTSVNDLYDTYEYFQKEISNFYLQNKNYENIFSALCKLTAVKEIFHANDYEDPHAVFEHVNADRKELTLADKVRNFLLLSDKYGTARSLYNLIWRPMEEKFIDHFDDKERQDKLDDFVLKFLQLKIPGVAKSNAYEKFRIYLTDLINEQEEANQNSSFQVGQINNHVSLENSPITLNNLDKNFKDVEDDSDEIDNNEPLSTSDKTRLNWLKELTYYSYFYILFNCNFYDDNNLSVGRKEGKLGQEPYRFTYHAYSWNIRVILYWLRMLKTTSPYVLFFKLFEWEDKKQISQLTLEKLLYLMLNYTIRLTIFDDNNVCPLDKVFNSILPTIYATNNINDQFINDDNCYQLFINYLNKDAKGMFKQQFIKDEIIIDKLKETKISNPNLLSLLFLVVYYGKLLFPEDQLYKHKLYLIYILPFTDIEDFFKTSWLEKDPKHDWSGLTNSELTWILKNVVYKIGNLGIINEPVWKKIIGNTKARGKTDQINWFFLPGNDFLQKKIFFSRSLFADSLYEIMLESNDWNSVAINKRTIELISKIIKCLPYLIGEDYGSKN